MDAWINAIIEMTGIGRSGVNISLSDVNALVPETRALVLAGAATAFCIVAAWQDAWLDRREEKKSDRNRPWNRGR